ncbi:Anaphase-promoting complex subunit 5-like [Scleropages formosus]|uniref:Anaphase-promoting complex subunit 5 n=1 Tax=Scleropages formosus TaxID=113540 RepID=A0A0P7U0A0_SCLFO|nr:Anaphase-promoting complex subunit 5-like [Scleropages formosus]
MASVHESLYFNPMMTNGVVHANVFGIKDWVTPYKISVLVLLDEMTISKRMTLLERRRLNKLILPLQQGPDLTLRHFLKTVEECSAETAFAVKLRLHMMVVGELKDMESFFDTLPNPFSDAESEASKTSVVGLFMRHMLLAYNKLSFSQVYKLYTALQRYYDDCLGSQPGPPTAPPVDADMELSEMELTSTEDGAEGKMDKEEPDAGPMQYSELLDEAPRRCPLSQKQAEYFLARQAYLLKNDENKALKPAALQEELNNMLKFNPDFAEAHYLSYLNSMRVQDVFISTHSLLHYFDRLILTGGDGKSNGDEGYGRSLRYAALNLAALHCRFGHYQQAELALQEAIRIAQESNDHVCLQHCLMKGSDSSVLTEDSVKMAAHFGLPYLASLGIQSLVQQGATGGKAANMLMDALKDTDILHWKHSLSELIDISLAQTTSIWRMYGKSTMALQCAQVLLNMNSLEQVDFGVQQNNTEAFAVVLCHLAELHAEQGLFGASSEILKHLKERFPPHTQHAKLWMLCDLKIQFERAMNDGKYHLAEPHVAAIAALDQMEGLYRVLQRLQLLCEKTKCTEMIIRVMLTTAELHWESSGFSTALPLLLQALVLARQHHLQALASETILHLAFSQLMLGVPEQALNILHEAMEPILAHGALLDKGPGLEQAVQTLDEAAAYFSRMGCKDRLRDTHYLQARLHHALGHTAQRNECALLFRMVDQELPPARANLANRL